MMENNLEFLDQVVEFLGFLQSKLRGLKGIATLTYELIQNADDVKDQSGKPGGASEIKFDVKDDALIIENDGVFREIDFERMQRIAFGGKREEEDTTGAFGIGFISVYQISDSPEIFSTGRHWRLRPDMPPGRKIEQRRIQTEKTRFRLPWAFEESDVRRQLRLEIVRKDQLDDFALEMEQAIRLAALFVKHLRTFELSQNGHLLLRLHRLVNDGVLILDDGENKVNWRIFRGNFDDAANQMRAKFGYLIEKKKKSTIEIAVPNNPLDIGTLYAVLPTEMKLPFPFHINADFYTNEDRKRVLLGQDFQSDWNRAAITAAAETLALNFDEITPMFTAKELWRFLFQISQATKVERIDPAFNHFWARLSPLLSGKPIVETTKSQYCLPANARLIDRDEEFAATSIFEKLKINIVHEDLRDYYPLLMELGVPRLRLQDIISAFQANKLGEITRLESAPEGLKSQSGWVKIWKAINAIWKTRASSKDQENARLQLSSYAIAFDINGFLCPPRQLFNGDEDARALFQDVKWFKDVSSDADPIPRSLIQTFKVGDAIEYLQKKSSEQISDDIQKGKINVPKLFDWFETYRAQITFNPSWVQGLRKLAIWPAGGCNRPLEGLYLAGGFEDPFHLASFVDVAALGGRQEFLLHELQVKQLDFVTYIKDIIPSVLAQKTSLAARRALVLLLAQRMGEIQDNVEVQGLLKNLPIVECKDEVYRPAQQVYFLSDIVSVLGSGIHLANLPPGNEESVKALYSWLGVTADPRHQDVLNRIKQITSEPPSKLNLPEIEKVFVYIAVHWSIWDEDQQRYFEELVRMRWLPGTLTPGQWHSPDILFPSFRDYLFASQGNFLNFPRPVQDKASSFFKYLGMNREIPPIYVIKHLLYCSRVGERVNKEVYNFLNDKVDEDAIQFLEGQPCLLLPDESEVRYVRPNQVFWGDHPFGRFRYSLGPDLRRYDALFRRLGVREQQPVVQDYIQVLLDISDIYGKSNLILDEDTNAIVMTCWQYLSRAYDYGDVTDDEIIAKLKSHKVIPDPRGLLAPPERLFFEDRAGLAQKFKQLIQNDVIAHTEGAWLGMEIAGVKPLSKAVSIDLTLASDQRHDVFLEDRVKERRILIQRVIDSQKASGAEGLNSEILDQIEFVQVSELEIRFSIHAFNRVLSIEPELTNAVFKDLTLFSVHQNGSVNWAAVSRELAYAIQPSGEVGSLAMGIKEILGNTTFEGANISLDELGYPPLQELDTTPVVSGETIGELGGEPAPEDPLGAILGGEDPNRPPMPPTLPEGGERIGRTPSKPRKKKSRLMSYVYPDEAVIDPSEPKKDAKHRSIVEKAGIDRVINYERLYYRRAVDVNKEHVNHPGYDLESADENGQVRYIEVKALSGIWESTNPALMTRTEFETAKEMRDQFWLYIVERATAEDENEVFIYCIQNPANRAQYYLFDAGWEPLAVE